MKEENFSMHLPIRSGPKPTTTATNPHSQLDQNPPPDLVAEVARDLFGFVGVLEGPSALSVPGARAAWLDPDLVRGPRNAFLIGTEFAHIHPLPDGSLHAALPPRLAEEAVAAGWAEIHPVARRGLIPMNVVMLYAPRTREELGVTLALVNASYRFARGDATG